MTTSAAAAETVQEHSSLCSSAVIRQAALQSRTRKCGTDRRRQAVRHNQQNSHEFGEKWSIHPSIRMPVCRMIFRVTYAWTSAAAHLNTSKCSITVLSCIYLTNANMIITSLLAENWCNLTAICEPLNLNFSLRVFRFLQWCSR